MVKITEMGFVQESGAQEVARTPSALPFTQLKFCEFPDGVVA